jgi:hypothetical protein
MSTHCRPTTTRHGTAHTLANDLTDFNAFSHGFDACVPKYPITLIARRYLPDQVDESRPTGRNYRTNIALDPRQDLADMRTET